MRNSAPSIPPFCFPSHEGPPVHTTKTKFNNFRIRVPPRHDMPRLGSKPFGSAGRVSESWCCWWITSKAGSDEWGSLYGKLPQKRQMNVNHSAVVVLAENLFDNIPKGVQTEQWQGGQYSLESPPFQHYEH